MEHDLKHYLKGTIELEHIKEIEKIYKNLSKKQDAFTNTFNIHCKKGCGECCKHFIPDASEFECLYTAYNLIENHLEEFALKRIEVSKGDGCPFFDNEKHCLIYLYRPLLCRLFNAAASTNKNNEPVFRTCKWNDKNNFDYASLFKQHKNKVITMDDYGEEILSNGNEEENKLFPECLKESINKLLFIKELEKNSKK